jgi:uncharacterized RmlC-like cupin family protein
MLKDPSEADDCGNGNEFLVPRQTSAGSSNEKKNVEAFEKHKDEVPILVCLLYSHCHCLGVGPVGRRSYKARSRSHVKSMSTISQTLRMRALSAGLRGIKNAELNRGLPMDWAKHGVKIIHSDELDLNTPQTSGMTRTAAITHAKAGASKLWAGTMVVQPDAKTGPHHHEELETVLYVVKGRIRMRWGDQLELSEEARPGDFIYVPPYVPHQEINASPSEVCEAGVVRDRQDPIVVNLDLHTPEPASAGHSGMPFHPDR